MGPEGQAYVAAGRANFSPKNACLQRAEGPLRIHPNKALPQPLAAPQLPAERICHTIVVLGFRLGGVSYICGQMQESLSILTEAVQRDLMADQLRMVVRREKLIPNSVNYDMRRFVRMPGWQVDDIGLLEYNYVGKRHPENSLQLKFCLSGRAYCDEEECIEGEVCKKTGLDNCREEVDTVDVYSFRFT